MDKAQQTKILTSVHPDDYDPAIEKLCRSAAEKGHWQAQIALAHALAEGIGVTPDPTEAYAWLYVAVMVHPPFGSLVRDKLANALTEEELAIGRTKGEELLHKFTKVWDKPTVVIIRPDPQPTKD